jgi:hypothetical protein
MDIAQFRVNFPAFSDAVRYPDPVITFWSSLAVGFVSDEALGSLYNQAIELFTAHHLFIAAQGADSAGAAGPVQSKAVGSVSVSYDSSSSLELNAGHWNSSSYGKIFIQLIRQHGHGCYQL